MIKRISSFLMMVLFSQWAVAQSVSDYYGAAKGTCGQQLKTALYGIVKDHQPRTYGDLWEDFRKTDCRPDGKVWDMYSNMTSYDFGSAQQGASASAEGYGFNREHSFPKSWFKDGEPMYTDLFHLYPVDTYINSMRSNLPFGETEQPKKTSKNGWSKYGPSSVEGYTGTVFEPNDQYKGDFARSYFYMATRYENEIADWTNKKGEVFPMLNSTSYPAFSEWALKMLLRWSKEDPVDQKEIDRNNAVYDIQKNRNPYIDYPGLEQYVWGDKMAEAFDPEHYNPGNGDHHPDQQAVAAPVFSIDGGQVKPGTEVVLSCATGGATIYYRMNGGEWLSHLAPAVIAVHENLDLEAYAQLDEHKSDTVRCSFVVVDASVTDGETYVQISGESDLVIGADYLVVCEEYATALAEASGKDYRLGTEVTITSHAVQTKVAMTGYPSALTLGGAPDSYTFYDAATATYLSVTSDKNKLYDLSEVKNAASLWTVSFTDEGMTIHNNQYTERRINYNANKGQERFAAYKSNSGQSAVALYKKTEASGIEYEVMDDGTVDVYTLDGRLLRDNVEAQRATVGLSRGVYLIGGVKIFVR